MMDNEARGPMPNVDPPLQAGEVLLRIKSASHPSCEDLEFNAQSSLSVRQIKESIQRLSAHHPEIKEQRLIYSGHLLDDNQLLKDVLTANSGSIPPHQAVTIHLACNSKSFFNNTPASSRIGGHKPGNDGHPGENGIPQQAMFNNQGFPGGNMGMHQRPGGIPQDVLSLHQLYVEQMTAYMNNWYMYQGAMGGMLYQYPPPPVNVGNFVPPVAAPFQAQNNNNAVPPIRVQAADNIAAARAGDDDENQRDLLDWMYTLSRVVLVFSVVYFYSSFSRFLLVVVFTALVMILQRRNGPANVNAEGAVPPPPRVDRAQPNPAPPHPNGDGNENPADGGDLREGPDNEEQINNPNEPERVPTADSDGVNGADQNENEGQVVAEAPPQANMREVALTFLTTFFTSLIPETYQNN